MILGQATSLVLFLSFATSALAQCEAPVPCQDEELNRLNTTECTTYHAFIARGSDSGYPGHLGGLIKLVNGNLTSDSKTTFGYENVVYPAKSWAAGKDTWCQSAAQGATGGQKQMTDYANRCPDAKLILMGYSQGGSVGLDILGGGGGPVFECTQEDNPPLDRLESPGSKIVAAAIFGAVRRSAHQNYTVKGGKEYHGKAERTSDQLAGLAKYSSVLREWCNTGDPMCAANSSPLDVAQHLNYFKLYNDEAAKWVVGTAKGEKVADQESSTTVSSTKTATKTASKTSAKHVETAASTPTPTSKTDVQGNAQEQTQGSGAASKIVGVFTAWSIAVGAFAWAL